MSVLDRVALLSELQQSSSCWKLLVSTCPDEDKHRLLGFFRAVKSEMPKSTSDADLCDAVVERLHVANEWRRTSGILEAMTDSTMLAAERQIRSLLHYDFLGPDQYGRPVMVERVGQWDVSEILARAEADPDHFDLLHCMALEHLQAARRPDGARDPRGHVIIINCDGFRYHMLRHSPRLARVMLRLLRLDQAYYPDSMAIMFVVNMPSTFATLAYLLRPFMSRETLDKVELSSTIPARLYDTLGPSLAALAIPSKVEPSLS